MTRVSARSEARCFVGLLCGFVFVSPIPSVFYERSRIVLPLPTPHQKAAYLFFRRLLGTLEDLSC